MSWTTPRRYTINTGGQRVGEGEVLDRELHSLPLASTVVPDGFGGYFPVVVFAGQEVWRGRRAMVLKDEALQAACSHMINYVRWQMANFDNDHPHRRAEDRP